MQNSDQRRFVILWHEMPLNSDTDTSRGDHFDLMFQVGQQLRSWACESEPQVGASLHVKRLPKHRLAYLDYEGPISNDRGRVSRWDFGDYELVHETEDQFIVKAHGAKLVATLTFTLESDGWMLQVG